MSAIPLSRRVILARQHADLSREELAERVVSVYGGTFTAEQIQAIENGDAKYSRRLVDIAVICGVEIEWLGLGEGAMTAGAPAPDVDANRTEADKEEGRLVEAFRLLPPDVRAAQLLTIERLALPFRSSYKSWSETMEEIVAKRA